MKLSPKPLELQALTHCALVHRVFVLASTHAARLQLSRALSVVATSLRCSRLGSLRFLAGVTQRRAHTIAHLVTAAVLIYSGSTQFARGPVVPSGR